uniref:DUF2229 domain-containing protein n=1 Tax=Muribaculaceae bacterium Z82 TaxID=2304548 RepID=A0A7C9NKJ6_9BACT
MPQPKEWADVRVIGIPRALLYYRFGELWKTFFEQLGYQVQLSDPTDKDIADEGDRLSVDECCLASKVFMGHVANLAGRCDAVFVPCYSSEQPRHGFCTKFQSVTDLVRNTFRDQKLRIASCHITDARSEKNVRRALEGMAVRMGASVRDAKKASKAAWSAQAAHDKALADSQERLVKAMEAQRKSLRKTEKAAIAANAKAEKTLAAANAKAQRAALSDHKLPEGAISKAAKAAVAADEAIAQVDAAAAPLSILVVAHPYITRDAYLSGAVLEALESMDVTVLYAEAVDHDKAYKESFEFSDTMPWLINRELIGAILLLEDQVDGIVLISAFPCGPDSMTNDAIMRCIQGKPILNLMIDAQSGTAGVETRVESFVDILRFQQKGGYVHE